MMNDRDWWQQDSGARYRELRNTTVTLRRPRYGPGARAELKAAPLQRPHEDAEDQDQAGRDRREADRTADDRGARLFGLHGCAP
jgi:hypothetical protein